MVSGGVPVTDVQETNAASLPQVVRGFASRGARFVTMTAFDRGNSTELLYHFEEQGELRHLRVMVEVDMVVPSISGIYLCAFLVENEVGELFGVQIDGIAIDYRGRLYLTEDSDPAPMRRPVEPGE